MLATPILAAALALTLPRGAPSRPAAPSASSPLRVAIGRRTFVRELGALGAAAAVLPAAAFDSMPDADAQFAELEKRRKERKQMEKINRDRIKPFLKKIVNAENKNAFADACDELSLWLIGEGRLPEGIDPASVRDAITDSYELLPTTPYECDRTRDNNGICYSPGQPADGAYKAALKELRKYATKKGKGGASNSDGVSSANSAAF